MSFQAKNSNERKLALVTGASSGIGAVYADRLAREGYNLVLVARRQDRLVELANRLEDDYKIEVQTIVADLSRQPDLATVEECIIQNENIEMLVNNAGVGIYKLLAETPPQDLDEMVLLNILALTRLTHAVLPQMLKRHSGTIINVAGGLAFIPSSTRATYGATKAYGVLFTRSLHQEVQDKGIQVQVVCPGLTYSEFHQRSGTDLSQMPTNTIMSTEDLVDASLAGLKLGEVVCIPGLPDTIVLKEWEEVSANLRTQMNANNSKPAPRYQLSN
jgi:short-subunit dehydrogenase